MRRPVYLAKPATGRLKALTRPGGHHAHSVFTTRLVYVEKGEVVDHFAPREFAATDADWTIGRQAARLISCTQDGRPHRHSVEEFVAMAAGHS